jgi:4-oxalomesaconate tautomerase
VSLVAPPRAGGALCTRTFIPRDCHAAIGVLGAVTVAAACVWPGSVAAGLAAVPAGARKRLAIEHPSGEFTVELDVEEADGRPRLRRSALLRTARLLFDGYVHVPAGVWDGRSGRPEPERRAAAAPGR